MKGNFFDKLRLSKIINASGKMTKLGVSIISDEVADAMKIGGQNFFHMEELHREANKFVANFFQSESAFISNSASSGIALTVAAQINKGKLKFVENYHKYLDLLNREIVIPKGHNINYGASIEEMINLGGGILLEAGSANECTQEQVENSISEKTVALFFIKSHHSVQKNMLSIDEMQALALKYDLPLIVDAAAEEDFSKYKSYDIVIFSGGKALEGPTSGIVIGRKKYLENLAIQEKGLGRAMKIDKANIFGILEAINNYYKFKHKKEQLDVTNFISELNKIKHLKASLLKDEAGREIYRVELEIDRFSPKTASIIAQELKNGEIKIFVREYYLNLNKLHLDTRSLTKEDLREILNKIKFIMID